MPLFTNIKFITMIAGADFVWLYCWLRSLTDWIPDLTSQPQCVDLLEKRRQLLKMYHVISLSTPYSWCVQVLPVVKKKLCY
jgi:hypothetical protein